MWIAFSRLGLTNVQAAFIMLCCFYFSIFGVEKKKIWAIIVGGVFLGLCIYSYIATRITPFIITPYFLLSVVGNKKKKQVIGYFFILLFIAICVSLPQALFYLNNPSAFNSRSNDVYIFSNTLIVKEWRASEYPNESIGIILQNQFLQTINIFNGDQAGHYGYKGQLLDWVTVILFILGLFYSFQFSKKKWIFLLEWFLLVMVGSVLTTSPITLSRIVVGLPVIYIFPALGFEAILERIKKWRIFLSWVMILVIGYIVYFNLMIYFVQYPIQQSTGEAGDMNARNARDIAFYLDNLSPSNHAVFLTPPNLYASFAPLVFLSPSVLKTDVLDPENYTISQPCQEDTSFIIYPQYTDRLSTIQKACLHSTTFTSYTPNGNIRYYIVQNY